MKLFKKKSTSGFTLIELLVVIGIIAILFAVVLVSIDPAKRLKQSRDATRKQDVADILEAVQEYIVDNSGQFPTGLTAGTSYSMLGTAASGCSISACGFTTTPTVNTACLDLSSSTIPTYLSSMPVDPLAAAGNKGVWASTKTGYAINRSSAGRINVIACDAEISDISLQR